MFAAQSGHVEMVSKLFQSGANVNRVNNTGKSALMFAAGSGYAEVVSKLLHRGAVVNQVSIDGDTAATLALKHKKGRCAEVIIDIIVKLKKYEKIQKRKNRALIKEFEKLPPEMRIEIMNHIQGTDDIDQLAKSMKSKLTAEQMMLLYLFKEDAQPVIKKLQDKKPNAMQMDFIALPVQIQQAIIKKHDAKLYDRLMKKQSVTVT